MSRNHVGAIEHLISATRYSFQGLCYAWASEAAFRYEIYVLAVALPTAWFLDEGAVERALLIGSVSLVVVVELINSAIETSVDRVGKEPNELSGYAKDLASAAVFVAIVLAAVVWLILLLA